MYDLEYGSMQDLKSANLLIPKDLNESICLSGISSKYSLKSFTEAKKVIMSMLIKPVKLPAPIKLTSTVAKTSAGIVLNDEKNKFKKTIL